MTLLMFGVFGTLLGFLSYSSYFITKVSKGLSIKHLYELVYSDPIGDELLLYTFYNLFWCRIVLFISWVLTIWFGGLVYVLFKI